MKEKAKTEKPSGAGGDSIFDAIPAPESQNVSVSSGPYSEELPVAGTTVGEVRRRFKDRFDIDDQAVAVVGGTPKDDKYLLATGEALMFIRHAGEKGAEVIIRGDRAGANGQDMSVEELCRRVGPGMSTGEVVLPDGVKTVLSQGNMTLWFWEQAPRIVKLSWIRHNSPRPYGPGATYRDVRISLPYLIIMASFVKDDKGLPSLNIHGNECFFRTEPLKSIEDELSYPGLLNCSKYPGGVNDNTPLSWICTQYLKSTKKAASKEPGDRFSAGLEAVRYCLLETSFNLSSEHHEGNSWYGASKKIDPRIATIEEWEKSTKKDPLFVLDVPWIKTGHSVRKLAERFFRIHGQANGAVKNADDLARIIINH